MNNLPSFNVLGDHTYTTTGLSFITVTITDKGGAPPLVVNATANVPTSPTLQMYGTYTHVDLAAGAPQGNPALWVIAQFTPASNALPTAYNFTINWGDGMTDTGTPTFYMPLNPLQNGESVAIQDTHVYATGSTTPGTPQYYTITITITGPGITSPLVGTIMEPVYEPNVN